MPIDVSNPPLRLGDLCRSAACTQDAQAAQRSALQGAGTTLLERDAAKPVSADHRVLPRDPELRGAYLQAALGAVPRLLASVDRNPYSPAYGCFDRQYWHYRTSSFPSEMYQEAVLPLAMVYVHPFPGNRWYRAERVRELAIAGIRFAARSSHRDGSCDDYYPFERAFGAAVFSLQAAAQAYLLLELEDPALRAWLVRRARWVATRGETGKLTNHHALGALGLDAVYRLTGEAEFAQVRDALVARVLAWQSPEGWFSEYEGADLGYQTLTIDCLAKLARSTDRCPFADALDRAVRFARAFLHPDGSFGGAYGSRGTVQYYPHGLELLADTSADAADLADAHLNYLAAGRQLPYADDRLYVHRLASLLGAWLDWSPVRPAGSQAGAHACFFSEAGLLVHRSQTQSTIVSTARGGVVRHQSASGTVWDTGLVVRLSDGRLAVSQQHDRGRYVRWEPGPASTGTSKQHVLHGTSPVCGQGTLVVSGPLYWQRHELATPWKHVLLHLAMLFVGRWCRNVVRKLLQRRLITGRRRALIWLTRQIEFLPQPHASGNWHIRITDELELHDPRLRVAAMAYSSDLETAYVAAAGADEAASLQRWTDLAELVPVLNRHRRAVIVREF